MRKIRKRSFHFLCTAIRQSRSVSRRFLPRMARMMAMQKAECGNLIREIREIRGSIPLVAAGRVAPFAPFRGQIRNPQWPQWPRFRHSKMFGSAIFSGCSVGAVRRIRATGSTLQEIKTLQKRLTDGISRHLMTQHSNCDRMKTCPRISGSGSVGIVFALLFQLVATEGQVRPLASRRQLLSGHVPAAAKGLPPVDRLPGENRSRSRHFAAVAKVKINWPKGFNKFTTRPAQISITG